MISDPAAPTLAPISVLGVPDTAQQHAVRDVVIGDLAELLDRP